MLLFYFCIELLRKSDPKLLYLTLPHLYFFDSAKYCVLSLLNCHSHSVDFKKYCRFYITVRKLFASILKVCYIFDFIYIKSLIPHDVIAI